MEELVPEAEEGTKRAEQLEQDLQNSQQEMQTILREREAAEQAVSGLFEGHICCKASATCLLGRCSWRVVLQSCRLGLQLPCKVRGRPSSRLLTIDCRWRH